MSALSLETLLGGTLHEAVEITETRCADGSVFRSLVAKGKIAPGTSLLSIPDSHLLTAEAADEVCRCHGFDLVSSGLELTDAGLISLSLAVIRRCSSIGEGSASHPCARWFSYVRLCLTDALAFTLLHRHDPAELKADSSSAFLDGTPLGLALPWAQTSLVEQVKQIAENPAVKAALGLSPEDLLCGHSHYCSRAMAVPPAPTELRPAFSFLKRSSQSADGSAAGVPAMVPLADLANHDPKASTSLGGPKFERKKAPGSSAASAVHVVCGSRSPQDAAGQEIFISYGHKSQAELLAHYGFALPKGFVNKADLLHFRLVSRTEPATNSEDDARASNPVKLELQFAPDPVCFVELLNSARKRQRLDKEGDGKRDESAVFTAGHACPAIELLEKAAKMLAVADEAKPSLPPATASAGESWQAAALKTEIELFLDSHGDVAGKRAIAWLRDELCKLKDLLLVSPFSASALHSSSSQASSSLPAAAFKAVNTQVTTHLIAYRAGLAAVVDSQLAFLDGC